MQSKQPYTLFYKVKNDSTIVVFFQFLSFTDPAFRIVLCIAQGLDGPNYLRRLLA